MESSPSEKTNLGSRRAKKQDKSILKNNEAYQRKRKEIIDASMNLFSANGYDKTSISQIASVMNFDRATLYYYFSSKDEIYQEISTNIAIKNVVEIENIAKSDMNPKDKLLNAMTSRNKSYQESFPILQIFLNKLLVEMNFGTNISSIGQEWSARYYQAIRSILEQGCEQGYFEMKLPVGVIALGIIGMLNWAQATSQRYGRGNANSHMTPEEIGAGFAETIFSGILINGGAK